MTEFVFDVCRLQGIFRTAAPIDNLLCNRASIACRYADASRMPERGTHALDLRIDAGSDALDEVEYARIAQTLCP